MENRSRAYRCTFRLNEAENRKLQARLQQAKIKSKQEFLRRAALDAPIVCLDELRPILHEMKKAGANLNTLLHFCHRTGTPAAAAEVEKVGKELQEAWQQLNSFLKRVQ